MMNDAIGTRVIEWPYPIQYNEEEKADYDVLVLGGGISGCWAAISAARKGAKVALVEKGATKRGGAGGTGLDHWNFATDNPCSKISPEEITRIMIDSWGGYNNGITDYILCSTGYEILLEMEKMGAKVRDTEDEFKNADFRDEETKLLFAYDYDTRFCIRVWGTTFKPALHKELKRLGVKIYNRVMATSLLTENGEQGGRVVGASGLNTRTGKLYIFKAKATILCMATPTRNWTFSTELKGVSQFYPPNRVGNGHAMAWSAGAEFTMMEMSIQAHLDDGNRYPNYGTGNAENTWYPCTMVDNNGKEIPWVDADGNVLQTVSERCHPSKEQKHFIPLLRPPYKYKYAHPRLIPDLKMRIEKGEFTLPLYADLTSMPEHERRVIWGVMIGEEAKTKVPILDNYTRAGFDPKRDLLQSYYMLRGDAMYGFSLPQERVFIGGGLMVDWDLRTNLAGLYAAGEQVFSYRGAAGAATSGRWAGRKAAEYALKAEIPRVERKQIESEKARIYAPLYREGGIDWKELSAGLSRIMQHYCSEPKTEALMNIGLTALKEIEEEEAQALHADNPHKLMRALDVLDILTCDQIITNACLARKASSQYLNFARLDYPENDPKEWHKFITINNEDGQVKVREKPIDFYEPLKETYEAHCGLL